MIKYMEGGKKSLTQNLGSVGFLCQISKESLEYSGRGMFILERKPPHTH